MDNQNQKIDELYINIPYTLKAQVDSEFSDKSQLQRDKIYFLIWKINHEKNHQVNVRNYAYMLSLKTGELTKILDSLRKLLIINTSGTYQKGKTSNSYYMLKPFQLNKATDFQNLYKTGTCSIPTWVQRYCTDKGVAMAKEHSKFNNVSQPKKVKTILDTDKELNALRKKVLQLEAENAALKMQFNQPITVDDIDEQVEVIDGCNDIIDVSVIPSYQSDDKLYSINLNKELKVIYETTLPHGNDFLDYLSSTIKQFPIYYKRGDYVGVLSGDTIKIKAA